MIRSGSGEWNSPSTFATTGIRGGDSVMRFSIARSGSAAGATIAVWNAWLTGSRIARCPRSSSNSIARSTAEVAPPSTSWLPEFTLASTT